MSFFPIFDWLKTYRRTDFYSDVFAGVITMILSVPQGIAYALLAGLPPEFGLYANILPPLVYVVLGTSHTLRVGPASIGAIMIASALNLPEVSQLGNPLQSAVILSAESGVIMLLMAMFRMGKLVNFISHPVLTGFVSGAAILIIESQLPQTLGLKSPVCGFDLNCYETYFQRVNFTTLLMSLAVFAILLFFKKPLSVLLRKIGVSVTLTSAIAKCGAIIAVVSATLAVTYGQLDVAIVGDIPAGLPNLSIDFIDMMRWKVLLPSATFIALIAYVGSVAVAKVMANLRGEKIDSNQELIALGMANFVAGMSGGMQVSGGFSQTMVNFAAGARTQISTVIGVIILSITVIFFSSCFSNIPKASLAVIILVAIVPLVKIKSIFHSWHYDKGDGIAEAITLVGVLFLGLEEGITLGIFLTFISLLRKTSHPHIAVLGRIPNTPYYRNIKNHCMDCLEIWDNLLLLRIDESITFANINFIEEFMTAELKAAPKTKHVVLVFTSVSDIDMTALQALEQMNINLKDVGISFNLAEIKHFVLVKLEKSHLLNQLNGKVFFDTEAAVNSLI
ncbi:MAG: SulP family inorganic anion transporter [Methylococcales bacterium]|nr:SulP family inorganic anion transporter [Methylococcales bacterium]MDD5754173.1 SulP family inorganic anion transporter [Methylococcales bacterium]